MTCHEVTCNECEASLQVTAHLKVQVGKGMTNQFSIKSSMHAQGCSLCMKSREHDDVN